MTTGSSSIAQLRPDELVDVLTADFQRRAEPNFAWKSVVSQNLALPLLRAFWPMSSVAHIAAANDVRDASNNGNHLANTGLCTFGYDALVPYAEFDGVNQFLSKADGGAADWADITGTEAHVISAQQGLTLGGWFWLDTLAPGNNMGLMSKWNDVTDQRSYALAWNDASNSFRFGISTDGTIGTANVFEGAVATAQTWYFVVGRFDNANNELKIWVNDATATAVEAGTIFDGTAAFFIGSLNTAGANNERLDGRASMCFLCAAALSDAIIGQLYEQSRVAFAVL